MHAGLQVSTESCLLLTFQSSKELDITRARRIIGHVEGTDGFSIFSTSLTSVKNHDKVSSNIPDMAHPKKRLDALANSTITPERIIPNG